MDITDSKNLINNSDKMHIDENDLRTLNFHHENVNWEKINEIIKIMPWRTLFEGKTIKNARRSS